MSVRHGLSGVLAALALVSLGAPFVAHAAELGVRPGYSGDLVQHTVRQVEAGFRRKTAVLDAQTKEQPSAQALGQLFPAFGFAPLTNTDVSWSLNGMNVDQAVICVGLVTRSVTQWNDITVRMHRMGLTPATAGCEAQAQYAHAPQSFPATIRALKLLDRRDTPVPTVLPAHPVVSGVDESAVTRPGLVVTAGAPAIVTVSNPFVLVNAGPPPVGLTVGLVAAKVRPGFTVEHSCGSLAPDTGCTVMVRYAGTDGSNFPGSLRLEFSNGAVAVVGLLGKTAP